MKHLKLFGLAALALGTAGVAQPPIEAGDLPASLPINQLQILGTHNSYSEPIDPRLVKLAEPQLARFQSMLATMPAERLALFSEEHPNMGKLSFDEALSYRHTDLKSQLDLGLRSLELDVNPDPEGGLFLHPAGYRILKQQGAKDLLPIDTKALAQPGYKVLHMPDYDFRSRCALFTTCLEQIKQWSDAHPDHVPLFILVEAKVQAIPIFPDPTRAVPFDASRFDELDREILSVIPRDRIITPDDVRGDYPTLNAAVRAGNWPKLGQARGKILFLMLTASGDDGTKAYLAGHPSLRGRVAFLRAEPGEDHAAFLMYDNALVRGAEIRKYVREGYLVRTRSDIETYEAKINDKTRADAAFASGAQIVSTDFPIPGNAYGTSYVVQLPGSGAARMITP